MKPLGEAKCFTKEHIEANRKEAPPYLAELAIRALELVAELSEAGLGFTFKGGNSLLLILDEPRRFSIDVDITTAESKELVVKVVENCVQKHGVFARAEHRPHKTKPWLPMTSFNLYFDSAVTGSEAFIMLDVMFRPSLYKLQKKSVVCGKLFSSSVSVVLPTESSILADKLLTLGPTTLGIPYGKGKEAQRIKHIHDVALLTKQQINLVEIREAIRVCYKQELELQNRPYSFSDILKDTLHFLAQTTVSDIEPSVNSDSDTGLRELVVGRAPFEEHLFKKDYSWLRLQRDAALCAAALHSAINESVCEEEFRRLLATEDPLLVWKLISPTF